MRRVLDMTCAVCDVCSRIKKIYRLTNKNCTQKKLITQDFTNIF